MESNVLQPQVYLHSSAVKDTCFVPCICPSYHCNRLVWNSCFGRCRKSTTEVEATTKDDEGYSAALTQRGLLFEAKLLLCWLSFLASFPCASSSKGSGSPLVHLDSLLASAENLKISITEKYPGPHGIQVSHCGFKTDAFTGSM